MRGLKKTLSMILAMAMMLSVFAGLASIDSYAALDDVTVTKEANPVAGQLNTWDVQVTIQAEVAQAGEDFDLPDGVYTDDIATGFALQGTPTFSNTEDGSLGEATDTADIVWNVPTLKGAAQIDGTFFAQETLNYRVTVGTDLPNIGTGGLAGLNVEANTKLVYTFNADDKEVIPANYPMVTPTVIDLTKIIADDNTTPDPDNRTFTVELTGPEGFTPMTHTFELNATPENTRVFLTPVGPTGTYTFTETAVNGTPAGLDDLTDYDITYSYYTAWPAATAVVDSNEIAINSNAYYVATVTNDLIEEGELTITKDTNYNPVDLPDQEFTFYVAGPNFYNESFTLTKGGSKTLTGLPYGTYKITEAVPKNFNVTAPADHPVSVTLDANNDEETVAFYNEYTSPEAPIKVEKIWTNGGPTNKPDVQIQVYRESAGEAKTAVGAPITLKFPETVDMKDYPVTDAAGNPYTYSVVEITALPNYSTSYSKAFDFISFFKVFENGNLRMITPPWGDIVDNDDDWFDKIDVLQVYNRYNDMNTDDPIFPIKQSGDHIKFIVGYPDDSVRPEGQLTRAEAATMFAKLLADELNETIPNVTSTGFTDSEDAWYTNFVAYMKDKNIISGYEDGSFKPNQTITRAEFATMVAKLANKSGIPTSFIDTEGHWAQSYLEEVYAAAIVSGDPDGSFRPDDNIKRVEAASILNRVFNRAINEAGLGTFASSIETFTDLSKTYWGYYIMVEATNGHTYDRPVGTVMEKWLSLIK